MFKLIYTFYNSLYKIETSQSDGYAEQLGSSGTFQHSSGNNYGENLYGGPLSAVQCVNMWYFECEGSYDYSSNTNSLSCGKLKNEY